MTEAQRILKGEVVISAEDATGSVFAQLEAKTARLRQQVGALSGVVGRGLPASLEKLDRSMSKMGAAIAGGYAVAKVSQALGKVVEIYKSFDDIVRYQRAITGMTPEQQAPFITQATHLGATTPYNDIKVLQAQLDLMQRGVKTEFVGPITEMAADYAQAMNAELPEAAKTIEGILFSTRKHIEDGNQALAVAHHTVDYAVKLAKIGGLDNEDVTQLFKYAGLSGSTAGLSDESIGAMAALMRRSNIRGDEAGVAIRSIAGSLVSPTQKGQAALLSMGIDWSKFLQMPGALSVDRLDMLMKQNLGKQIPASMRGRLAAALSNPELLGDQATFVAKLSELLGPMFAGGKRKGAQDSEKFAKTVQQFYKNAAKSVDSEGLLRAIIQAHPTLAQANALFGQKQGARALAAMSDPKLFHEFFEKLKETPEGFAHQIAVERLAGFSGALQRTEGALMNLWTALGRANDPFLTEGFNRLAQALQSISQLSPSTLKFASEVGIATAAIIGMRAAAIAFQTAVGLAQLARGGGATVAAAAGAGAEARGAAAGAAAGGTLSAGALLRLAGWTGALLWALYPQPAGESDEEELARRKPEMARGRPMSAREEKRFPPRWPETVGLAPPMRGGRFGYGSEADEEEPGGRKPKTGRGQFPPLTPQDEEWFDAVEKLHLSVGDRHAPTAVEKRELLLATPPPTRDEPVRLAGDATVTVKIEAPEWLRATVEHDGNIEGVKIRGTTGDVGVSWPDVGAGNILP